MKKYWTNSQTCHCVKKQSPDDCKCHIIAYSVLSAGGGSAFGGEMFDDDDDEMYEEARICVMEAGKASTSYLQRKLKLGYARAARLMDKLEERGVIGPGDGAKPREVLEKIMRDENGNNIVE